MLVDLGLDAGLAAFLTAASCVICVALLCGARRLCRMCRRRGYGSVDADELLDDDVWADDDDDDGDDDDLQAASIRVQLVLDDDAAEGDGVEEFAPLGSQRAVAVADVKGAMAAMYADDGAAERALARRMVVQCLGDERGLLVALPGRTPVAQLRGADHLLVSLRGGQRARPRDRRRRRRGGSVGHQQIVGAARRPRCCRAPSTARSEGARGGVVVRACDGGGASTAADRTAAVAAAAEVGAAAAARAGSDSHE